jgi:hypothetical protein
VSGAFRAIDGGTDRVTTLRYRRGGALRSGRNTFRSGQEAQPLRVFPPWYLTNIGIR